MGDEKHPNDDYVNPGSATAAPPIPAEVFADDLAASQNPPPVKGEAKGAAKPA
jgi:hypothetical protein